MENLEPGFVQSENENSRSSLEIESTRQKTGRGNPEKLHCTAGKGETLELSESSKTQRKKGKVRSGNDTSSGKITGLSEGQPEGITLNSNAGKQWVEENRKEGINQPE